jgi:hypothetical protein
LAARLDGNEAVAASEISLAGKADCQQAGQSWMTQWKTGTSVRKAAAIKGRA